MRRMSSIALLLISGLVFESAYAQEMIAEVDWKNPEIENSRIAPLDVARAVGIDARAAQALSSLHLPVLGMLPSDMVRVLRSQGDRLAPFGTLSDDSNTVVGTVPYLDGMGYALNYQIAPGFSAQITADRKSHVAPEHIIFYEPDPAEKGSDEDNEIFASTAFIDRYGVQYYVDFYCEEMTIKEACSDDSLARLVSENLVILYPGTPE